MNQLRQGKTACTYKDDCRLEESFVTNSKVFWVSKYCLGDKQDQCKRRSLCESGLTVPAKLLPNGSYL